jgi:cobaltochelatase CobN
VFLAALLAAQAAPAATLFGIVSERAAPLAAEAARLHLAAHPGDRLILRTPAQFMAAPERDAERWLDDADAVLAVAVFGDPARRLKHLVQRQDKRALRVMAFNGEQNLSLLSRSASGRLQGFPGDTLRDLALETPPPAALEKAGAHPVAKEWLALRRTWQGGGSANVARLLAYLSHPAAVLPAPTAEAGLRLRLGDVELLDEAVGNTEAALAPGPTLVVLDLANSDPAPADALCAESRRRGAACAVLMARWSEQSKRALENLTQILAPARPSALIVLQDFVIGAAEGREAVSQALLKLGVPVLKALRITERNATQWRLSPDGLPPETVQYRVALPELQGTGQPVVVAVAGKAVTDRSTGLEIRRPQLVAAEGGRLVARALRWQKLAQLPNQDKRVALIYYNHPPGRQNIGADNLNVPASLFDMLHALKAAGYRTGELPASPEALLDRIMQRGVNLPEDDAALRQMAQEIEGVGRADYARWFATLPARVRDEMTQGPLGRLHADVLEAERHGEWALGRERAAAALKELHHLLAGAEHAQRALALRLIVQLEQGYAECLSGSTARARPRCARLGALKSRLTALGIEGLRGWGAAPGQVMVAGERLLVPGIRFGNVFVGPQPPRGWEVNEELLHANTSVPPPHQYLAFYHWIKDRFRADAMVHVGRHSTYEFLPGKAVGLAADDYPSLIAGDIPGLYPYIVDGVGEGIQAKRRGLAVIIDHLTPPIATTPLYDQLLVLRQVVESYEAANSEALKAKAARAMREQVEALHLKAELEASMAGELKVRGIGFDQADDDLLAHEVGHYLTKLQEKFMPYGLHVFGRDWSAENLKLMMGSMNRGGETSAAELAAIEAKLAASPKAEMAALLAGLNGAYIRPGKGNDPLRSPDALPTGRNFHAVDGDLLPTRIGHGLGRDLAAKATQKASNTGSEGVLLWASDAVRDEGVMVGFSLALMGAEPVWNPRGIVTDVRLLPDAERRDVIITTSGLFRDLYPNLLNLIDRAGRLALAASAQKLVDQNPLLQEALLAALAPLTNATWGSQPLAANRLAERWQARALALQAQGLGAAEAGREAAWRIFGDASGAYGAGVNRLTERSGAWRERGEIARAYLNRMGHAYALDNRGDAAHAALNLAMSDIRRSYHGRASHLYGLLDNNDAFDYLGGMSLAVEQLTGAPPEAMILQHAEAGRAEVEPLAVALLGELRGRFLNPAWLKPLMAQGYSGARTFGQEFLENLWGWQVTRPDLIKNWAWDEVRQVYFEDRHKLGLPAFLNDGHNAHVKAHMLAIFMVAAHKGYWQTDATTLKALGGELTRLVAKNGLPGSGHTAPGNPMWDWLRPRLDATDQQRLDATLARARGSEERSRAYAAGAGKLAATPAAAAMPAAPRPPAVPAAPAPPARAFELSTLPRAEPARHPALLAALLLLFLAGLARGRRVPVPHPSRRLP